MNRPMQHKSCYDIDYLIAVLQEKQVSPDIITMFRIADRPRVIAPCLADDFHT